MRMGRMNISMSDDLVAKAKALGLNVSRLAAAAVALEVRKSEKNAYIDRYLAELEAEQGPIPEHEMRDAQAWVDGLVVGSAPSTDGRKAA
jgi:post-segregation antitoxin (ccd killing protein)